MSKEAKFTPGPWAHDHCDVFGGGKLIVECYDSELTETETKANANLIAAAPDLYQELSDILGVIEMACKIQGKSIMQADLNKVDWKSFYEPAKEALAKARGENVSKS